MPMKEPPHPGLSVRHDCLQPLGLTITDGAKVLGISRQALNSLVNGKGGISPEMAIRLDKAFGGSADAWLALQTATIWPRPRSWLRTSLSSATSRVSAKESRSRLRPLRLQ